MPPCSTLRSFSLAFAAGVFLELLAPNLYALPFATGRAGGGYSFLTGDKGGKASSSAMLSGVGRFGYLLDESSLLFALDVTAYRVYKNSVTGHNSDGNSALAIFGFQWGTSSFWMGAGAGEIRIYDRTDKYEDGRQRPNRFYANEWALGWHLQIYDADYARVEVGAELNRIAPDADWRAKTKSSSINSLQIDIGFKLFNW